MSSSVGGTGHGFGVSMQMVSVCHTPPVHVYFSKQAVPPKAHTLPSVLHDPESTPPQASPPLDEETVEPLVVGAPPPVTWAPPAPPDPATVTSRSQPPATVHHEAAATRTARDPRFRAWSMATT
jgi:hypothetical protein